MVGAGLKKLAGEYGIQVHSGVAYGMMEGFPVTLSEGMGSKTLSVATRIENAEQERLFREQLSRHDLGREFRIQNLAINPKNITVVFLDNPGTMKKMRAFMGWFFPLLTECGANQGCLCPNCGGNASGGVWKLIDGVAYPMHESCAQEVTQGLDQIHEQQMEERTGSYATGFVGALIGALIGAAVWALVLSFGYVASIIGFVIGWLAERGYRITKGKPGKGKVVILVVVTILGVLIGTVGGDFISLAQMIGSGELPGWSYGEIPLMFLLLLTESEYLTSTLSNVGLGLLFGFLGVYSILRRAGRETARTKVSDLK